jgi:hypothetical protein
MSAGREVVSWLRGRVEVGRCTCVPSSAYGLGHKGHWQCAGGRALLLLLLLGCIVLQRQGVELRELSCLPS